MDKSSQPLFGLGDILILGVLIVSGYYYFFYRKKTSNKISSSAISLIPSSATNIDPGSMIPKLIAGGKNFLVIYGSQTGTAESFAGRLVQDARKYGLKSIAVDPEECDTEEFTQLASVKSNIIVFVMATYGEGDPTDNARDLYEWLNEDTPDLSGINYAVFGLGNKTYEHYNAMGKFYDKKLEECGATKLCPMGLGDDDGCLEEDFVTWKEEFWELTSRIFDLELVAGDLNNRQYKLTTHASNELSPEKIFTGEYFRLGSYANQKIPYDAKNPFLAPVTVNRNIFKGGSRECRHVELDITGSKLKYEPGDHIAVYPANDYQIVNHIGKILSVDLDQVISLTNMDEESSKINPFPCPCSYRTALTYYLDITSPLRTNVIKDITHYATDPGEVHKLTELTQTTSEGRALYAEFVIREHRDLLTFLRDFPSLRPPLDHICELLPRLQQRYYSISSSPKLFPDSIHITAVVLKWVSPLGLTVDGVTTNWLAKKNPTTAGSDQSDGIGNGDVASAATGDQKVRPDVGSEIDKYHMKVPLYIRRSQFKLPLKKVAPIVMIGPGTGLAPFRGFIQQRKFFKDQGKPVGENVLYFGCRNKKNDYIYQDELEGFEKDGTLSNLFLAFSRDQPEKIYVSNMMEKSKALVWDMIDKKLGHIYICGDAKNMAKDVHAILLNICQTEGGMELKEAEVYVKNLQIKSRYQCDVWS